jgi:asparagine synthase (glutamine-hydrolysing)
MYDVLRSDKSISSNGLEPRTPFLDRAFVEYYLSIPANIRCHSFNNKCEKYLLRESIEYANATLLPREILHRRKEAFSDGISSQDNKIPWYTKIKINSNDSLLSNEMKDYYLINNPTTNEMKYYRTIFDSYFTNNEIVKYFWMPRYVNAIDPSARTLECYS